MIIAYMVMACIVMAYIVLARKVLWMQSVESETFLHSFAFAPHSCVAPTCACSYTHRQNNSRTHEPVHTPLLNADTCMRAHSFKYTGARVRTHMHAPTHARKHTRIPCRSTPMSGPAFRGMSVLETCPFCNLKISMTL